MVAENFLRHLRIPMKSGPMQRCSSMLPPGVHRPAGCEHQSDCPRVVVLGGIDNFATVVLGERLDQAGTARQQRLEQVFVAQLTSLRQLQFLRTAVYQQTKNLLMPKFAGHHVRGLIMAKGPDINRAASPWISLWKTLLVDAHTNTSRI